MKIPSVAYRGIEGKRQRSETTEVRGQLRLCGVVQPGLLAFGFLRSLVPRAATTNSYSGLSGR